MLTLVKLGGSLITDKRVEQSFREPVMRRIAEELVSVFPSLAGQIVLGHGSGSFGHFAASRYGTIDGVHTREQWSGFSEVSRVASALNQHVIEVLAEVGLPAIGFQPSVTLEARDGVPQHMQIDSVERALASGLLPVLHGDVAFDSVRGGTIISTESLFTYLAQVMPVKRILLVGEVAGVLDDDGQVIERISPSTEAAAREVLKGSGGVDVTGGMLTKVGDMLALVRQHPGMEIRILDGTQPGRLAATLRDEPVISTLITAD